MLFDMLCDKMPKMDVFLETEIIQEFYAAEVMRERKMAGSS